MFYTELYENLYQYPTSSAFGLSDPESDLSGEQLFSLRGPSFRSFMRWFDYSQSYESIFRRRTDQNSRCGIVFLHFRLKQRFKIWILGANGQTDGRRAHGDNARRTQSLCKRRRDRFTGLLLSNEGWTSAPARLTHETDLSNPRIRDVK